MEGRVEEFFHVVDLMTETERIMRDYYSVGSRLFPEFHDLFNSLSQEEEQQILASLLGTVYLEWAEKPSPLLKGQSPRQYCAAQQDTKDVAAIIDHMEQHDLGRRRTGQPAYDYNILRAHIGL